MGRVDRYSAMLWPLVYSNRTFFFTDFDDLLELFVPTEICFDWLGQNELTIVENLVPS